MLAMPLAAILEPMTAKPLAQLIWDGALSVGLLSALITIATLVPVVQGVRYEGAGPFSPAAEKTNGRLAMLGFAALLLIEQQAGACFF
eukprot:evm.model.scf_3647.2 EVM.evm.TU.scf_3647.2   scf_3647:5004-5492(-)